MPVKKTTPPTPDPFAPISDELGALVKEMAPHAQKLARIEVLKKALRAGCPVAPCLSWTVTGEKFITELGPCANMRCVNLTALVKMIGAKAYSLFATTTLDALEKNVAPATVAAVVAITATGSRSLKTFEKPEV